MWLDSKKCRWFEHGVGFASIPSHDDDRNVTPSIRGPTPRLSRKLSWFTGKNMDVLLWIWARFLVAKPQSVIDNWRWSTISHQCKVYEFSWPWVRTSLLNPCWGEVWMRSSKSLMNFLVPWEAKGILAEFVPKAGSHHTVIGWGWCWGDMPSNWWP